MLKRLNELNIQDGFYLWFALINWGLRSAEFWLQMVLECWLRHTSREWFLHINGELQVPKIILVVWWDFYKTNGRNCFEIKGVGWCGHGCCFKPPYRMTLSLLLSLWQNGGGGRTEDKGWGCLLNKSSRSQVALIIQALILVSRQPAQTLLRRAHLCNNVRPSLSNPLTCAIFSSWMRGAECACGRTHISLFFLFLVALFLCALVHISGSGGCENSPGSFTILLPERDETWIARANNFYIHAHAALLCLIIISLLANHLVARKTWMRGAKCDFLLV